MAKFYVQCGPLQVILVADSIRQAAISAIDKSLQSHLWIYDDGGMNHEDCRKHLMLEALLHLEPTVQISEVGFDRTDAATMGTPEAIDAWHHLMVGMNRLFIAAGLAPRTMAAVAKSSSVKDEPLRRVPR